MPGTVVWFVLVLTALPASWLAGRYATRIKDPARRGVVIGAVVLMLFGWAWLIRHPALAVQLIPVSALARLEGVGAAPLFIFVIGVGWHLSSVRRQRAIMVLGMCLGVAYFLKGGIWMTRPTPAGAFSDSSKRLVVQQTQDYSCVPAASATALRMLGLRTTEAEMAELTETRAGSGATLLRALNGISERLSHTGVDARLLEPDYEQLLLLQAPMLTPLQYEASRLHMVTIVEVRPHLVLVADPQVGLEFLSRRQFIDAYRGQVIAFEGAADRATSEEVLEQFPYVIDPDAAKALALQAPADECEPSNR